jgi:hypothetical protein
MAGMLGRVERGRYMLGGRNAFPYGFVGHAVAYM